MGSSLEVSRIILNLLHQDAVITFFYFSVHFKCFL